MNSLPAELIVLGLSVLMLVAHIMVQGQLATRDRGLEYNAGPRDGGGKPLSDQAQRAKRALENFGETYPAFLGLALALAVTGSTGGIGAVGAWIWLLARVVYLPLYVLGVNWWRSVVYAVSMLGIFLMLIRLFF